MIWTIYEQYQFHLTYLKVWVTSLCSYKFLKKIWTEYLY